MNINFIQGIITYPTTGSFQSFLTKTGQYVSFSADNGHTDVAFAHGTSNYLLSESVSVPNAWGPLSGGVTYWLYWNLDKLTAVRTFGFTTLEPKYGSTAPTDPAADQHWFNTSTKKMYVYQSNVWLEVLRVFAAKVVDSTFTRLGSSYLSRPYAGSQVELDGIPNVLIGRIIADNVGRPIIRDNGQFFTTEDEFFVDGSPINAIRLESGIITAVAKNNMAKYQVVVFSNFNEVVPATYDIVETAVLAILTEDASIDETVSLCIEGKIDNPQWNWSEINMPLWVGVGGDLVTVDPHLTDPITYPTQRAPVARAISRTSIVFNQAVFTIIDQPPPQPIALDNLTDVVISSPSFGNALVFDGTRWINGTVNVATTLDGLTDVIIGSPAVGNTLVFDGAAWVNANAASLSALDDLTDVQITTPATGNILSFNGTRWVNLPPVVQPKSLVGLTDVQITSVATGQMLTYNGTKWVNINVPQQGIFSALLDGPDVNSITNQRQNTWAWNEDSLLTNGESGLIIKDSSTITSNGEPAILDISSSTVHPFRVNVDNILHDAPQSTFAVSLDGGLYANVSVGMVATKDLIQEDDTPLVTGVLQLQTGSVTYASLVAGAKIRLESATGPSDTDGTGSVGGSILINAGDTEHALGAAGDVTIAAGIAPAIATENGSYSGGKVSIASTKKVRIASDYGVLVGVGAADSEQQDAVDTLTADHQNAITHYHSGDTAETQVLPSTIDSILYAKGSDAFTNPIVLQSGSNMPQIPQWTIWTLKGTISARNTADHYSADFTTVVARDATSTTILSHDLVINSVSGDFESVNLAYSFEGDPVHRLSMNLENAPAESRAVCALRIVQVGISPIIDIVLDYLIITFDGPATVGGDSYPPDSPSTGWLVQNGAVNPTQGTDGSGSYLVSNTDPDPTAMGGVTFSATTPYTLVRWQGRYLEFKFLTPEYSPAPTTYADTLLCYGSILFASGNTLEFTIRAPGGEGANFFAYVHRDGFQTDFEFDASSKIHPVGEENTLQLTLDTGADAMVMRLNGSTVSSFPIGAISDYAVQSGTFTVRNGAITDIRTRNFDL